MSIVIGYFPLSVRTREMSVDHREIDAAGSADQAAFARRGYAVLPALLEMPLADFFWSYVHTKFASMLLSAADKQVPNSPYGYGDPAFDGLLEYLRPRIEGRCGLRLLPTYSYFRLYARGAVLKRHRDRPACEISVSLNIGQLPSEPWPLYVMGNSASYGAMLAPGDALLYRGIDCFHWREPFQGSRLVQVFLHYVDRDGRHADQKFDGRKTLMRPKERDAAIGNQSTDM
jgi:hypothetical protein